MATEKNEDWPQGPPPADAKKPPDIREKFVAPGAPKHSDEFVNFLPGQGALRRSHNIALVMRKLQNGVSEKRISEELERVGFTTSKIAEYIQLGKKWRRQNEKGEFNGHEE
jgi:hypothetical protein